MAQSSTTLSLDRHAPDGRKILLRVQRYLDRKYGSAPWPSRRRRSIEAQRTAAYIVFCQEKADWLAPPPLSEASKALGESERTLKRRRALAREVQAATEAAR